MKEELLTEDRVIPHIIHYCWFGRGEKPLNIQRYITGWRELLPDYRIIEWNENNIDIEQTPLYVKEAYHAHKYAFVSDYIRIKMLCDYGGIYFDTDIEVVKRFDALLTDREMVLGFESDGLLETAFLACNRGNEIMLEFCRTYQNRRFLNADGSFDMTVINQHFSSHMTKYGIDLKDESYRLFQNDKIAVFPREYFAAFDISNWHIKPTDNTYTIHHMNASWSNGKKKLYFRVILLLQKILGYKGYDKLKRVLDGLRGRK